MATFATRTETQQGRAMTAKEIFAVTAARETNLSRMLMLYIATGLLFMFLPGTFLGVWNLISISSRQTAASVSAAWVQAHGHAQIFGWIGTFILGIGFYSLPKLRKSEPFAMSAAWLCWGLWTAGVVLRWAVNIYLWRWRLMLPLSASLELLAFVIFFYCVSGHKPERSAGQQKKKFEPWVLVVISGTVGFLLTLTINLAGCLYVAAVGAGPAFSQDFDQRFLALAAWGFLVPFVWGFSAKWLPVFLGLKAPRMPLLLFALSVDVAGVGLALAGKMRTAVVILLLAAMLAPIALRLFEKTQQAPKIKGVHPSFPVFIRSAYLWLTVAAALGVWAAFTSGSHGIWGASRHALTVGFISIMVFSIGPRVLPAFSGMRLLFSSKLMFAGLSLLTIGCILRVSAEIIAYQGYGTWAWSWLPVSAITELTAVTTFAVNMLITFAQRPAPYLVLHPEG
jgi:uncharacterized protein involved in response to NO